MERGLSLKYIFRSNGDRVSSQGRRKRDDSCFKTPGGRASGAPRKPRPLSTEIQRQNNFLGLSRKSFSLRRHRHNSELNGPGSSPPSDWAHDLQLISTSKIHPNIKVEKGRIEFIRPEPDSPSICGNEEGDSVNDHSSSVDRPCKEKALLEVCEVENSDGSKQRERADFQAQFRRPKSCSMDHSLDWKAGPDKNLVNEDKIREAVHEHDRCKRRMKSLQEDVRRMEETVRSMLHYRNQVNDLQVEKSNICKDFENRIVNYENYLKDLKGENDSLRSELKQIKETESPNALLQKQILVLQQENLSLRSDNEELKLQCDRCFDDIAKEIVQTILVHKTLKEECSRLQMKNHMLTEIIRGNVSGPSNGHVHRGCSHRRRSDNEQRNFKSRLPVPCTKAPSGVAATNKSRVITCDNLASGDGASSVCRPSKCCVHSPLSQPQCCLSPVSLPSPTRPEPCSPGLLSSSWAGSAGRCGDPGCNGCANTILTVPDNVSAHNYPPMCSPTFYSGRVSFPPDVVPPEDVCKSVLWCRQPDAQGNLRAGGGPGPFASNSGYSPPLPANFIPVKPQDSVPNHVKDEGYSTMSSDVQLDKSQGSNPSNISVINPRLRSPVPMETVVSKLTVCKQKIQSLNIVIEGAEPSHASQYKFISQVDEVIYDKPDDGREDFSRIASNSPTPLPSPPNFCANSEILGMSRSLESARSARLRASSLLKRSLSDSEIFIVKPLCFDKRGVIDCLNGNSLPENCTSISDVSVDLESSSFSPVTVHGGASCHLPYDRQELEDWTLHDDGKKGSYPYPKHTVGSLASIQENSLELEEDSTECLWTPTYFCDDCDHPGERCHTAWGGPEDGDDMSVAHSQLSILDGNQLWPSSGDWEAGLCVSKEHLASHPSLQDMLAEADGDFKLKCSGNDNDFRADFYKLVKFGSSKSLCSSLKSIVGMEPDGGAVPSHDGSVSELSPPDREVALHSVLKFLAEQRLYFQSLELEDERVFPSARPTSDKSTEVALFEAEERCSSVSCPSPDLDVGRDPAVTSPSNHKICNLQDLLVIEEVEEDEVVLTPEGEVDGEVEEGTMTTWFHFEPDTDLSDPKTRANILDTMVGSSSQSDEESDFDEGKPDHSCKQYGHFHRLHRLRRQKKASQRGRQVFRLQANHRQTILNYTDFFVRFGKEEKDAVASFDFLNDLSTSVSDCSTELPQDPSESHPSRVKKCGSSVQFPATSEGDDCRCLSRSSTVSFNSQNQDVLPEAYLFSDSCAASCYTTSDSSGED